MPTNLELGTRRAKHFTRATLVDGYGTVIGRALCDLWYLPDGGLRPFDEFQIRVEQDSGGGCTLILDQDPITDWYFSYTLGGFRANDTVTVNCSDASGIVRLKAG